MKGGIRITAVTTMLHFLVDGLCICCLYMMIPFFHSAQIMAYIFVYNVLAFMSQPLIEIMVDMLERKDKMLQESAGSYRRNHQDSTGSIQQGKTSFNDRILCIADDKLFRNHMGKGFCRRT